MSAKLIVIEGLDGSGKATQAKILAHSLSSIGKKVKLISFPDYNSPSSMLVKLYLNGDISKNLSDINAYAASSFYSADRYISYIKSWKHDYETLDFIIADRYTTSNAVYQLAKLPKIEWDQYINWLEDYEYNKLSLPKPDLVIYLDMPIIISQELMSIRYNGDTQKKDIHESNLKFLENCKNTAVYLSEKLAWKVVNCYCTVDNVNLTPRSIDDIHSDICEIVSDY